MIKFILKILALGAFSAYILLLAMIVFNGDLNDVDGGVNYTLFETIKRYQPGSGDFWINVVGNVVIFLPLGFFAGYFTRRGGFFGLIIAAVLVFGVPIGIEFAQREIGRVFDVDDILLNSVGGIIGYVAQIIFRPRRRY